MSYEITNPVPYDQGTAPKSEPTAPLSAMMDRANDIAAEVLFMAYRIDRHMFGLDKPTDDKAEPQCFRDALSIQIATLEKAAKELNLIMESLGV